VAADPILIARDVVKHRVSGDRRFTVRLADLDFVPGDLRALRGPSGSGKSTVLDLIALTLEPDAAGQFTARVDGTDVDVMDLWRRRDDDGLARLRARLYGYVLQVGGLLRFLSVAENVRLPLVLEDRPDAAAVQAMLDRLGIGDQADKRPEQLSVGQRQRAAIARALIHRPPILLADEPTAALDPASAHTVFDLLVSAATEQGAATLVASHDVDKVDHHGLRPLDLDLSTDPANPGAVFSGGAAP